MQCATLGNGRGTRWRVRIPDRRIERMRGLLGRHRMEPDEALLLPRCRSIHTLGMRFPIRVAFLDPALVVLKVRDVPPGRAFVRDRPAEHLLELPAGADVRPGDRLLAVPSRDRAPGSGGADILTRLLPR